jgi:hypothetical protein
MQKIQLKNRRIAIATMHAKEKVIAPLLEKHFELTCAVPNINTDALGTFSGEIIRVGSPLDTARKKCEMAMELTGYDLAISSEGSFGAHPYIPFVSANEELVFFMDRKNDFEIIGRELTIETNLNESAVKSLEEALEFAKRVSFPEHGLIIREKEHAEALFKGVSDPTNYIEIIEDLLLNNSEIWVETDMRAMFNPTRMRAIEKATKDLIAKLESFCPTCQFPGFWVTKALPGLPCSLCNMPTKSTSEYVYGCLKCDYSESKIHPHGKMVEDPTYCDFCNP